MIKKLVILLIISINCFGAEDPFAWIQRDKQKHDKEVEREKAHAKEEKSHSGSNPNELRIDLPENQNKLIERYFTKNIQRATTGVQRIAISCAAVFLFAYSARLLAQKKPSFKVYSMLAGSILSFFCNKELVDVLNKKEGKIGLAAVLLIYLHRELAKSFMPKELFDLIYKK